MFEKRVRFLVPFVDFNLINPSQIKNLPVVRVFLNWVNFISKVSINIFLKLKIKSFSNYVNHFFSVPSFFYSIQNF